MNKKKKKNRQYIACIWCGKDINKKYAKYYSDKCRSEALGQKLEGRCYYEQ